MMAISQAKTKEKNQFKAWAILFSCLVLVYLFGVSLGPWLQQHIWGMDAIVQVMQEQEIDGGAYYYTEIEGAHDGQAYLNQSLKSMAPEHYGLTLPFISGIILCLLILFFGFRSLPR